MVFSSIPTAALIRSTTHRKSALPPFFIYALRSLRELTLIPVRPHRYTSIDEAKAEPFFSSHRIKVGRRTRAKMWKDLSLNRAQDLIHPVLGIPYTDRTITRYIQAKYKIEHGNVIDRNPQDHNGVRSVTLTPLSTLTDEWRSFYKDAGPALLRLISGEAEQIKGVYSETAFKLMRLMGWIEGEGLGLKSDGRLEPVNATGTSGNRNGLGIHRQGKIGADSKHSSLVAIIEEERRPTTAICGNSTG